MPRDIAARRPVIRVREIGIDHALRRAAGGRRGALRQRRIAAFVIVERAVNMQADRIARTIGLGLRRRGHRDRANARTAKARIRIRTSFETDGYDRGSSALALK